MTQMTTRRDELAANLAHLEARIQQACTSSARRRDEVTLIAVTKTWPLEDCRLLTELGISDLGENRDHEAAEKAAALHARWHFVGSVQTNKARSVASYAQVVHSVDRPSLVSVLGDGAVRAERLVEVLLQVSLDGDPDRGGALPEDVPGLAEQVVLTDGLKLTGVMAVAPLGEDPAAAFARLAEVSRRLQADHPTATAVSAGMTGDLEQAVAAGATHLRVGTALLGARPAPLR